MSHPDAEPRRHDGAVASYGPDYAEANRYAAEEVNTRPASPFGNDFPEHAPGPERSAGPIADALGYASDRLDLIEHKLGDLNGIIERLGYNLRPVLAADGDAIEDPGRVTTPEATEVDRRSTVARRITALGTRADDLGSIVSYLAAKVEALDEALELEGVTR